MVSPVWGGTLQKYSVPNELHFQSTDREERYGKAKFGGRWIGHQTQSDPAPLRVQRQMMLAKVREDLSLLDLTGYLPDSALAGISESQLDKLQEDLRRPSLVKNEPDPGLRAAIDAAIVYQEDQPTRSDIAARPRRYSKHGRRTSSYSPTAASSLAQPGIGDRQRRLGNADPAVLDKPSGGRPPDKWNKIWREILKVALSPDEFPPRDKLSKVVKATIPDLSDSYVRAKLKEVYEYLEPKSSGQRTDKPLKSEKMIDLEILKIASTLDGLPDRAEELTRTLKDKFPKVSESDIHSKVADAYGVAKRS
jgi:hypothetical protein